jgi:acyl dehydratase
MSSIAYNDLVVGARFEGPGRTITETDLSLSCMLTGDWHPIHADAEFAKKTPIGQRMLHGPFGILLVMGMATHLPEFADEVIAATGIQEWRYHAPIVVGDTLHTETIIDRRFKLVNHQGKVIQDGLAGAMIRLGAAGTQS